MRKRITLLIVLMALLSVACREVDNSIPAAWLTRHGIAVDTDDCVEQGDGRELCSYKQDDGIWKTFYLECKHDGSCYIESIDAKADNN